MPSAAPRIWDHAFSCSSKREYSGSAGFGAMDFFFLVSFFMLGSGLSRSFPSILHGRLSEGIATEAILAPAILVPFRGKPDIISYDRM